MCTFSDVPSSSVATSVQLLSSFGSTVHGVYFSYPGCTLEGSRWGILTHQIILVLYTLYACVHFPPFEYKLFESRDQMAIYYVSWNPRKRWNRNGFLVNGFFNKIYIKWTFHWNIHLCGYTCSSEKLRSNMVNL